MLLPQYLSHIQYCSWDTQGWAILDWEEGASAGTLGLGAAGPGGVQRAEWWVSVSLTLWNDRAVFGQFTALKQDITISISSGGGFFQDGKGRCSRAVERTLQQDVMPCPPNSHQAQALAQELARAYTGLPQAKGGLFLPYQVFAGLCCQKQASPLSKQHLLPPIKSQGLPFFVFPLLSPTAANQGDNAKDDNQGKAGDDRDDNSHGVRRGKGRKRGEIWSLSIWFSCS